MCIYKIQEKIRSSIFLLIWIQYERGMDVFQISFSCISLMHIMNVFEMHFIKVPTPIHVFMFKSGYLAIGAEFIFISFSNTYQHSKKWKNTFIIHKKKVNRSSVSTHTYFNPLNNQRTKYCKVNFLEFLHFPIKN